MASGGPRQPANPAPVSVPQSGRRTDGGAGSTKQPLRVPTGGPYGSAQATEQLQGSAPMAAGGPMPGGAPGGQGAPGGGLPPGMEGGVFGPAAGGGAPMGAPPAGPNQLMTEDPQLFLRVLAQNFPHPAIRRLVDWSASGANPTSGLAMSGPPTTMSQRSAAPTPPRPQSAAPTPRTQGVTTSGEMATPAEVAEGF